MQAFVLIKSYTEPSIANILLIHNLGLKLVSIECIEATRSLSLSFSPFVALFVVCFGSKLSNHYFLSLTCVCTISTLKRY